MVLLRAVERHLAIYLVISELGKCSLYSTGYMPWVRFTEHSKISYQSSFLASWLLCRIVFMMRRNRNRLLKSWFESP